MTAPYLHVPKDFKQTRHCLDRGLKIRKDRLYYIAHHAEAFGAYMKRCREEYERGVVSFARDVCGDKKATWGGI